MEWIAGSSPAMTSNGSLSRAAGIMRREAGRLHSAWLSMMYPRLAITRQLLKEDGAIMAQAVHLAPSNAPRQKPPSRRHSPDAPTWTGGQRPRKLLAKHGSLVRRRPVQLEHVLCHDADNGNFFHRCPFSLRGCNQHESGTLRCRRGRAASTPSLAERRLSSWKFVDFLCLTS
jgi:hypothetical protein